MTLHIYRLEGPGYGFKSIIDILMHERSLKITHTLPLMHEQLLEIKLTLPLMHGRLLQITRTLILMN